MTPEEIKQLRLEIQEDPANDITSMDDFARALGYTGRHARKNVQRWESGDNEPKGPALVLLRYWQERRGASKPALRSPHPRASLSDT